jgi:hypothetical protein
MTAQLEIPLDFLVVADHTEYMGLLPRLRAADPVVLLDPAGKRLFDSLKADGRTGRSTLYALAASKRARTPLIDNASLKQSIWAEITELAEQHNAPGRFTTLIGFEWTPMPDGDNLHRVVIYRDGADEARRMIPPSSFDTERPEELWDFMEEYEHETQGRILAIPHNSNVSNGRMFAVEDSNGRPFDSDYAARRSRYEPLVEATQIKGDSETHPFLSPDDEFADFETWDYGNIAVPPVPKTREMLQWEYVRAALKLGLDQSVRTGVNPFKFGMIGSTDAHTSFATADENNFWGKMSSMEPGPDRLSTPVFENPDAGIRVMPWDFVASGYAAVWARENTRESIFDAMQRKEVYATTGPRITVRFFGGWGYAKEDVLRPDAVRIGYHGGVPMGGDLPPIASAAPRFMVIAMRDPIGANLDRIQVVKGWREADGALAEKVYDVALSDGRRSFLGRARRVRSTVDVENATYTNDVGDAMLTAYWEDPDFSPEEPAFYYARVIEIPTPRWTVYDAVRLGAEVPPEVPTQVQDRAYTSPIWYSP